MTANELGVLVGIGVVLLGSTLKHAVQQSRLNRVRSRTQTVCAPKYKPRLWLIGAALVVSCICVATNPRVTVVIGPLVVIAAIGVRKYSLTREQVKYERDLPHALDAIARSMRSGASLLMAIAEAGSDLTSQVADDLAFVARQVEHGRAIDEALQGWAANREMQSVTLVTASLTLALKTGAAHAEVIDRVAITVRQSRKAVEVAKTHATQSRASAWALTLLPVLFTGPLVVVDPAVRQFLLGTWFGIAVLAVGLTLDGLGALWMSRLIRKAMT